MKETKKKKGGGVGKDGGKKKIKRDYVASILKHRNLNPESWVHSKTVFLKKFSKTIKLFYIATAHNKYAANPWTSTKTQEGVKRRTDTKEKTLKDCFVMNKVAENSVWQCRVEITVTFRKRDKDMKTWQTQYCFNTDLILESSCLLAIFYKYTLFVQ